MRTEDEHHEDDQCTRNHIWEEIRREFDTNNDGEISKEEFINGMKKIARTELHKSVESMD